MKKYLMTGIAALAICAAFTSCSKDIEPISQNDLDQFEIQKIKANYEQVFIKTFGQEDEKRIDYLEQEVQKLRMLLDDLSAGNSIEHLEQFGLLDSMKKVMLGDRLFGRAKETEFVVFDSTSRENELRKKNWDMNLQKAYEKGKKLFMEGN